MQRMEDAGVPIPGGIKERMDYVAADSVELDSNVTHY